MDSMAISAHNQMALSAHNQALNDCHQAISNHHFLEDLRRKSTKIINHLSRNPQLKKSPSRDLYQVQNDPKIAKTKGVASHAKICKPVKDQVSFSGVKANDKSKAPSGGAFPAIASFFIPGLGESINNGSPKEFFKRSGISLGLSVTGILAVNTLLSKGMPVLGCVVAGVAGVGSLINGVFSVINAYKGNNN